VVQEVLVSVNYYSMIIFVEIRSKKGFRQRFSNLGVATLLRVAKYPKRVAKFDKKKNFITANKPKIRVLTSFLHLEGRHIP
jgi:hypothetical protein